MAAQRCHGCGWAVEGGYSTCRGRFDEVIARDFSDVRYFGVHRMLVDTYCLQHPDEFCESGKSLAAHLAGLCGILEGGASPAAGAPELQRWLSGSRAIAKPSLPEQRGSLTIGDLPSGEEPGAWASAVRRWAEETWAAYESLHPLARQWLAQAGAHKR